jgi:chemotaxis methyl-accepting protein methylase
VILRVLCGVRRRLRGGPPPGDYRAWLDRIGSSRIEYVSANLMYSETVSRLDPFDVVWCTGVLYHNPEQLRMVRRLFDLVVPGGVLALESATTARAAYLATRPLTPAAALYYAFAGDEGYEIGKAL